MRRFWEAIQDVFIMLLYLWLALMVAVAIIKTSEKEVTDELEDETTYYDYNEAN
jgi:hypothetical protein